MVALARAFGKCQSHDLMAIDSASVPVVMLMPHRGKADVGVASRSIVRRRELGALLRDLRADTGLTVEQVAGRLLVSPSKISRLETGQRGASPRDIRDLCDLYQVTDAAQREHLMALARESREQAWWQPYGLPSSYATFVGLEAAAARICDFDPGVFPGILQTPDYARAIHEGSMPRLEPEGIEQRIEVLVARQAILTRSDPPPPNLHVIVDEAVLHRPIGGAGVMRAQIGRVIEACGQPNVTVQVLTFDVGAHPALDSTFTVLELGDPVPDVVYVEGLAGHLYLERTQDVLRYQRVFKWLCSIALDQQGSVALLEQMSQTYQKA